MRIDNEGDIVPDIPMRALGFEHITPGTQIRTPRNELCKNNNTSTDFGEKLVEYSIINKMFRMKLEAHKVTSYVNSLREVFYRENYCFLTCFSKDNL